jgi:chondroitin AC lyase
MSTLTPERLLKAGDYRKDELENVIKARRGEEFSAHSFAKIFWQTEHFVFQRPGWYTSVRMYSTRNRSMEQPYNGEGLKNHYRADGTNHISLTGREYQDIAPVMDWRKIPGATILEGDSMPPENQIQKSGLTDFVGGVTDGLYGAASFDFISPLDSTKAKKSWFFFDREYICLGAAIRSDDRKNAVATTLNQCLLDGEVTVRNESGISAVTAGNRKIEKVNWVWHDSIGYYFIAPRSVNIFNQTASGTWYSINRQTSSSKAEVRKEVFRLWIDHGINPSDESYEYVVLPSSEISDIEKYAGDPLIDVLSNSSKLQSVYHRGLSIAYAVFYSPGTVLLPGDISVSADSPCMVMIRSAGEGISSITVSDPSRKQEKLMLTINRKITANEENFKTLPDGSGSNTILEIILPGEKYRGSSVTLKTE